MAVKEAKTLIEATPDFAEMVSDLVLDKFLSGVANKDILILLKWKDWAIVAGLSAGIGVGAYLIADRIDTWRYNKKLRKELEAAEPDDQTEDRLPLMRLDVDGVTVFAPPIMDSDGGPVPEDEYEALKKTLKTTIISNGYGKDEDGDHITAPSTEMVNPMMETAYSLDDLHGDMSGYRQMIATYFRKSDIAAYFNEETEKWEELDGQDIMSGVEQLIDDHHTGNIFVANHATETVFEIVYDGEHTFEEVECDS